MNNNQPITTLQRQDEETPIVAGNAAGVEIATSRVAQEVQAAMVVAKKFPRDEQAALARIEKACCRTKMAEASQYNYQRGGNQISGPSIRMAEMLAQNWGNVDFGVIEIEQRGTESLVMSYAWDLETNTRSTKLFTVPHYREKKNRATNRMEKIALEGTRDIYEMTANMGARRLRACILAIIPGDVQEQALEVCNQTLGAQFNDDTKAAMVGAFEDNFGVTVDRLEAYVGRRLDRFDAGNYVRLRRAYQTLLDGFAKVEEIFPPIAPTNGKPRSKFGFKNGKAEDEQKPEPKPKNTKATKAAQSPPETPKAEAPVDVPAEPEPVTEDDDAALDRALDDDAGGYGPYGCSACHRTFTEPSTNEEGDRQYCPFCGTGKPFVTADYEGDDILTLVESGDPIELAEQAAAAESDLPEDKTGQVRWRCDKGHKFADDERRASSRHSNGLCPKCLSKNIKPVEDAAQAA